MHPWRNLRAVGWVGLVVAAALTTGAWAAAGADGGGTATGGTATGSAVALRVTSSLLGDVPLPVPAVASGTATDPEAGFGPLSVTAGPVGLPGVLSVLQLGAGTSGTTAAGGATATSEADVQGLTVASGLVTGAGVSSTCQAGPASSSGSSRLAAVTLGSLALPLAPAPNTALGIPGIATVVVNEQVPIDVPGGSGIDVRALHVEVLPVSPGAATLDVVVGESRCSAGSRTTGSSLTPPSSAAVRGLPLVAAAAGRTPSPQGTGPGASSSPSPTAAPAATASPAAEAPVQPTLSVFPPGAAPGTDLVVTGNGYAGCHNVTISLDGRPLAATAPGPGGGFTDGGIPVPGDTAPGSHTIDGSCTSGPRLTRSTSLSVVRSGLHRSAFATSLWTPSQVPTSGVVVVVGVALACGSVPLVAFPSKLFNSTLRDNYAEVRGWFGLGATPSAMFLGAHPVWAFAGFLLAGGLLDGFLSPDFGANLSTLAVVLAMTASLVVITFSFRLPHLLYVRARMGEWGRLQVLPGALIVALACVGVSRLAHFEPGYLFGLVAGFTFSRQLATDTTGRLTLMASICLLGVGLLAWVARTPVAVAAARPDAGFWPIAGEACLVAIFVGALESVLFCLVPLRFLEGAKLTAWNRGAWAAIFAVAAFAFVEILLQPASGFLARSSSPRQALVALALFVGFGLFSIGFWAYFRFRPAVGRGRRPPAFRRPSPPARQGRRSRSP